MLKEIIKNGSFTFKLSHNGKNFYLNDSIQFRDKFGNQRSIKFESENPDDIVTNTDHCTFKFDESNMENEELIMFGR